MKGQGHSFALRNLGWSVLVFFLGWLATKLLDSYFDLAILSSAWSGVKTAVNFLQEDIPTPLWQICALAFFGLLFFVLNVRHSHQLVKALLEIEELKNPSTIKLGANAHSVIMTIADFLENNCHPANEDISRHLKLTKISTEAAIDELLSNSFLTSTRDANWFTYWDLTAEGRAYVLHPHTLSKA